MRNLTLVLVLVACTTARAELVKSLWGCFIPCAASGDLETPLGYLQVGYCGTSALGASMLRKIDPLCREKTGRDDAVAARATATDVASCASSANRCPQEGISRVGFTCHFVCPSEDHVIRKFTACASTGDEAWSHAKELCQDAIPPDSSFHSEATVCTPEGQTPCD